MEDASFMAKIGIGSKIKTDRIEYIVDDITDRDGFRTIHATAPADSRNTFELVRRYEHHDPGTQTVNVTINGMPLGEWAKR